ncbi:MAG TPA: bis(5'-nucleosyl)-tetraphosphatase (symmetrical) YqeK [Acholeplasma sp.]|nr:bis(5'-nucleosyl)-tetraphosphatase (symmetrical) YqeK [Acholeplasma sp.]
MIELIIKKLNEKFKNDRNRLTHIYGVRDRAIELAEIYHADKNKVELAALLHDMMKNELTDAQISYINDDYLINYYLDVPVAYHAVSGSIYAQRELSIEDEIILEAIKYHVWGKIDMSLENMIICVSDFCEPNRIYPKAREIYELAKKDLSLAFAQSLKATMDYLISCGIKPFKDQVAVYEYYKDKKGMYHNYNDAKGEKMELIKKAMGALEQVKAEDIKVYDMENGSPFYDYIIVATASERQANALIGYLKDLLKDSYEIKGVEGKKGGWMLVDLSSVVIHVFSSEQREFYGFDKRLQALKQIEVK